MDRNLSIGEWVAFVWNRTALGIGVLTGLYLAYVGYYWRAAAILFVLVPIYFWLHDRFDAP